MADLDTLNGYAQDLLDLCEAAVNVAGWAPDRVYLAPPGPAFDCDQLTVEVISLGDAPLATTGTIGAGRRIHAALNFVGFRVKMIQCVPMIDENGNPPDPADETSAAAMLSKSLWSIWTRVRTAQKEGDLFGGFCDALFYDGAFALEEEGGLAGYYLDFRAEIAGFANSGS